MRFLFTMLCCVLHLVRGNYLHNQNTEKQFMLHDDLERMAVKILKKLDRISSDYNNKLALAKWNFETNITQESRKLKEDILNDELNFKTSLLETMGEFPWQNLQNQYLRRQFEKLTSSSQIIDKELYKNYQRTLTEMQVLYADAVTTAMDCDINPGTNVNKADYLELQNFVNHQRRFKKIREPFIKYVRLSNNVSRAQKHNNTAEQWRAKYETEGFKDVVLDLWQQIKPLYLQLHAYIRKKLHDKYGSKIVTVKGPIPRHLCYYDKTLYPFAVRSSLDITHSLMEQNYTVHQMFHVAEEFYTSLGFNKMPESFWFNSIFEHPNDGRLMDCHASAWDFYDKQDVRIKQCAVASEYHFETAHHEMGHLQYYLQYKGQPNVYREGANEGFHEAVGDVILLSVRTPRHLKEIGLLDNNDEDEANSYENTINTLYAMAIQKVIGAIDNVIFDLWRWDLFEEHIELEDMNCHYWKLLYEYEGFEQPVERTKLDVDWVVPHMVYSAATVNYFVSYVVQFQFHRSLCKAAGQLENGAPLHNCDIYRSKEAGKLLRDMLKLGSSKPWPEAMQMITGQTRMDASALREYFAPLEQWLTAENERTGEFIGWIAPNYVLSAYSREAYTSPIYNVCEK